MSESFRYKIYRWLIFSRIKTAIGLDRCAIFMSIAAPMATETIQYFMSADIPVTGVSPISNLITVRLTEHERMKFYGTRAVYVSIDTVEFGGIV